MASLSVRRERDESVQRLGLKASLEIDMVHKMGEYPSAKKRRHSRRTVVVRDAACAVKENAERRM